MSKEPPHTNMQNRLDEMVEVYQNVHNPDIK